MTTWQDPRNLEPAISTGHDPAYAGVVVYVTPAAEEAMRATVTAATRILGAHGGAWAGAPPDPIAELDQHTYGAFFGFDFHLCADGPRLIEINTNAGGAWLHARTLADADAYIARFIEMFRTEWRAARGDRPWATAVICDDEPERQILRAEFAMAQKALESAGIQTQVVDAAALRWDEAAGRLRSPDGLSVDLVYNRVTDFYFTEPRHAALRAAWRADAAVITPGPRAYARLGDKRNLALLSDDVRLAQLGVDAADRARMAAHVPLTRLVDGGDHWWADRRSWFFKPATGFGSRAAYSGTKLTRGKWHEIAASSTPYVAQVFTPPPIRRIQRDGVRQDMRFDVRAFAYRGEVMLFAARLYRGQTTNFRTPGGGFAQVVIG